MLVMLKLPSFADKVLLTEDESLCKILTVALFNTWCSVLSLNTPFIDPGTFWPNEVMAAEKNMAVSKNIYFMINISIQR